jgi:hypothetical protein
MGGVADAVTLCGLGEEKADVPIWGDVWGISYLG